MIHRVLHVGDSMSKRFPEDVGSIGTISDASRWIEREVQPVSRLDNCRHMGRRQPNRREEGKGKRIHRSSTLRAGWNLLRRTRPPAYGIHTEQAFMILLTTCCFGRQGRLLHSWRFNTLPSQTSWRCWRNTCSKPTSRRTWWSCGFWQRKVILKRRNSCCRQTHLKRSPIQLMAYM